MSTTVNNGGQVVTFDFRQDGTSQSFNRLNYRLMPRGILYDEDASDILERFTDTEITIHPFRAILRDDSNEVAINFYMTEDASVTVSPANPYIIGQWSWLNMEDCYMEFKAVQFENISPATDIILGKCLYENSVLVGFDNSRRSYSQDYYEHINQDRPDFFVHSTELSEGATNTVRIGKGSAVIGGKRVTLTQEISSPAINLNITNGKKILVSINASGEVVLTSSDDEASPTAPAFPSNMLTVAIITLGANPSAITGANIEYIYTNNFVQVETPSQQTLTQLNDRVLDIESKRGQPNGYASLDENGKVPEAELPDSVLAGGEVFTFTNVLVATTDWVNEADSDATPTYEDYPYRADITATEITSEYSPDVRFAYAQIVEGIYAPVADTGAGIIKIYASEVPSADITIPVIICTKIN